MNGTTSSVNDNFTSMQRASNIASSLLGGAVQGYCGYLVISLMARMGVFKEKGLIEPTPFILCGVTNVAIVETASLIHDIALYALGDRNKYENLTHSQTTSAFDSLRQKSWKVINYANKLQRDVDVIYSRIFEIRTEEEIRVQYPTDEEYYLCDPRFMEVVRKAFWQEMNETIKRTVPRELSVYAVEAMGYKVFGNALFLRANTMIFVLGIFNKMSTIYQKAAEAEEKQRMAGN